MKTPRNSRRTLTVTIAVAAVAVSAGAWTLAQDKKPAEAEKKAPPATSSAASATTARPALTVTTTTPQSSDWPQTLTANGNIAAWQEAIIGAEISNYRLTEVLVNVGDVIKKGQLLARISSDAVAAELAQTQAAEAEAEAQLAEAKANADRARSLQPTGALSGQQINQLLTAEQTAAARLNSVRAKVKVDQLRLAHTRVLAPDDGVISARAATVGSLTQPGQELFRLIRGGRLEWRAEVTAAELAKLKPGATATVVTPNGDKVAGKVRMVAPTVDPQTRNALVYVDLASTGNAVRAGMFARGEFELGRSGALTLPQSAVLLRDGFSYVFALEGESKVTQKKVNVGRRSGERIEITGGLEANARVVANGVGFLSDGDVVRVVQAAAMKTAER
jgi:RND family efflux transporter MFP subunit